MNKTSKMTGFAVIVFLIGGFGLAVNPVSADNINTDQMFTVDTTFGTSDLFVSASPTWTIMPGVTVNTAQRFFIEDNSTFTVTGGGSLVSSTGNTYAGMRLGTYNGSGNAFVIISGGSTFEFTNSAAPVWAVAAGTTGITLDGTGSTFIAAGTYNTLTNEFESAKGYGVPITFINGDSLQVNDLDGGFIELSVIEIPEPASLGLLALGGLLIFKRRRN